MNKKEARRQNTGQKAKRKKVMIITAGVTVCILAVVVITSLLLSAPPQPEEDARVFVSRWNHIVLRDDGTFFAHLPHNVRKSGTYTEATMGDMITVSFTYDGRTEQGNIQDNVLTLPDEWDVGCAHGHGLRYTLR
ncbi:MAG: hypothetical protein FWD99_05985 [Oscillospiraceae bacterium]|nr:hypothetical protein [Oscillospiraceae bacterium]